MMTRAVFVLLNIAIWLDGAWSAGLLYPHMANNGDQLGPYRDDEGIQNNLVIPERFYEIDEDMLWVNENGVLSYLSRFSDNTPMPFDKLGFPYGPRLILPFWADHGISAHNPTAHIWYRESKDKDLFNRATKDVLNAFDDAGKFKAQRLHITTWQRVMSYGGYVTMIDGGDRKKRDTDSQILRKLSKRDASSSETTSGQNSYQVVIVTGGEGKDCYVMFNYHTIEWSEGYDGEETQIGFNSGFGDFFNMDRGGMTSLTQLPLYTNVNKAGRFMFRISGDRIIAAGPTVLA